MIDVRARICDILSEMLDNPDECEIYDTTRAFDRLERLVEKVQMYSVGWMLASACTSLDQGLDIRKKEISELLEEMETDLGIIYTKSPLEEK